MRGILVLLSTALLGQVSTPPKPQAPTTKPKPATPKAPATQKAAPTAKNPAPTTKAPTPLTSATMTDEQKIIYALGLSIAQSIAQFDLSPAELDVLKQAL